MGNNVAIADCRFGGRAVAALTIDSDQQAARHVANKLPAPYYYHSSLPTKQELIMTERNSTSAPQARRYTVGYRPNGGRPNPSPQLKIKGNWLEKMGFTTGRPVSITAENGCLMIRAEVGG